VAILHRGLFGPATGGVGPIATNQTTRRKPHERIIRTRPQTAGTPSAAQLASRERLGAASNLLQQVAAQIPYGILAEVLTHATTRNTLTGMIAAYFGDPTTFSLMQDRGYGGTWRRWQILRAVNYTPTQVRPRWIWTQTLPAGYDTLGACIVVADPSITGSDPWIDSTYSGGSADGVTMPVTVPWTASNYLAVMTAGPRTGGVYQVEHLRWQKVGTG